MHTTIRFLKVSVFVLVLLSVGSSFADDLGDFSLDDPLRGLPILSPDDPRLKQDYYQNHDDHGYGSQEEYIRGQERMGCEAQCDLDKVTCWKGCRLGNRGSYCLDNCDYAANICKSRCR